MATPLESAREDVEHWRAKAETSEGQKGAWMLLSFLMGLFLVAQFWSWAQTPDKVWEVDAGHPYIVFHYQLWSHREDTRYIWGKDEDGDPAWISIDDKGRPTGGSLSDDDYGDDYAGD